MKRSRPSKAALDAAKAAAQAKRASIGLEPVPAENVECPTCSGSGKVGVYRKVGQGIEEQWVPAGEQACHVCGGSGKR